MRVACPRYREGRAARTAPYRRPPPGRPPCTANHRRSLPITASHRQSPPITASHRQSPPVTADHRQSPPCTICLLACALLSHSLSREWFQDKGPCIAAQPQPRRLIFLQLVCVVPNADLAGCPTRRLGAYTVGTDLRVCGRSVGRTAGQAAGQPVVRTLHRHCLVEYIQGLRICHSPQSQTPENSWILVRSQTIIQPVERVVGSQQAFSNTIVRNSSDHQQLVDNL